MKATQVDVTSLCVRSIILASVLVSACSRDEPAAPAPAANPPPNAAQQAAPPAQPAAAPPQEAVSETQPEPLQATGQQWSPEAMEELLAPIALYPDSVLFQVLIASTNPQEVLDAGNWLIANPDLSGKALDEQAESTGFTPPIRALIQFPQVVDNMCLNLEWTEELGQAYVNDQAGVQAAVQRLRQQAESVGNLESSDYMKVSNETQNGQQTVIIEPADPQVIYVPQYDPNAAYAAQPSTASTAQTTTTTTTDEGFSTGDMIATGLFAFGAGMIVNEIFDDDDDWDDHHHYGWYGPAPYYPPYPYRPRYGGGFHPNHNYNRPNNYVRGNTVVINQNNNYYNRFDKKGGYNKRAPARSPITEARPNRNDLVRTQTPARPTRKASASPAVKGNYAGARPDKGGRKVQGNYAGAKDRTAANRVGSGNSRPSVDRARPADATARPAKTDRGYNSAGVNRSNKPASATARKSNNRNTAFGGAKTGTDARAAAKRGRKSGSGKDLKAKSRGKRR